MTDNQSVDAEIDKILIEFGELTVEPWANGSGRGVHYYKHEDGIAYIFDDEFKVAKAQLHQLLIKELQAVAKAGSSIRDEYEALKVMEDYLDKRIAHLQSQLNKEEV